MADRISDQLERQLKEKEQELQQKLETVDQDEEEQAATAASTPVYKQYWIVDCNYAQTHETEQKLIPDYTFSHPCIQKPPKQRPDVDCLGCSHHSVHPYGQQTLALHQKRYPERGAIFPVVSEELANADAELQAAHHAKVLLRPHHEVHALGVYIEGLKAAIRHAKAREAEADQGG